MRRPHERHLFEDRASGSRDDRAGLGRALVFIRLGDCLVVWKLDRLGRSLSHPSDHGHETQGAWRRVSVARLSRSTPRRCTGRAAFPHLRRARAVRGLSACAYQVASSLCPGRSPNGGVAIRPRWWRSWNPWWRFPRDEAPWFPSWACFATRPDWPCLGRIVDASDQPGPDERSRACVRTRRDLGGAGARALLQRLAAKPGMSHDEGRTLALALRVVDLPPGKRRWVYPTARDEYAMLSNPSRPERSDTPHQ